MQIVEDINITVADFKGHSRVDIRKYYIKDDELKPTQKGVNMSIAQWDAFVAKFDEVKAYVEKELGR